MHQTNAKFDPDKRQYIPKGLLIRIARGERPVEDCRTPPLPMNALDAGDETFDFLLAQTVEDMAVGERVAYLQQCHAGAEQVVASGDKKEISKLHRLIRLLKAYIV